ncbi:MAG: class I SAM-dependent methyltransferase, partial [Chloroflexi bacterium]
MHPDQPIFHPRFAAFYEWLFHCGLVRRFTDPLRQATAGQAYGVTLEVGVGLGLNFPFYSAERVESIDAIDPDPAMLAYARRRLSMTSIPIQLSQASVEALPFADATFDSVVVTLVFCSVSDPGIGVQEIKRVLKHEGSLFMCEHVRAKSAMVARLQDALVPVTTRCAGNCHWNRDTRHLVSEADFQ